MWHICVLSEMRRSEEEASKEAERQQSQTFLLCQYRMVSTMLQLHISYFM